MNSIRQILLKKLRSELTPTEQVQLDNWLAEHEANQQLLATLENEAHMTARLEKMEQLNEENAWQKLQQKRAATAVVVPMNAPQQRKNNSSAKLVRLAAAAILLLLIGSTCVYLFRKPARQKLQLTIVKKAINPTDVLPGGDKAVLTLADGTRITLDSAADGNLANQGNIKIVKLDNGQLAYKGNPVDASGQVLYNTITTPRGGQYQLVLSDGTKVWLNAASSFRYPVAFIGTSRRVELTGEGYFEVAKNKVLPFIVGVGSTDVTVLGTHFNIMAYPNEKAQEITLLEGSVRVSKGVHTAIIKPGQQAAVQADIKTLQADTEEAVAWKDGKFIFKDTDIYEIMRQLERWYDIEVTLKKYEDAPHFYGIISRTATLAQVLNMLEVTGMVNYSMEGKKLILK